MFFSTKYQAFMPQKKAKTFLKWVFLFTFACLHSHCGLLAGNQNRINSAMDLNDELATERTRNQPPADDYFDQSYLRFADFVYSNNIKSVLFNRVGWEFSLPIIELNSADKLELRFDDLDADFKSYAYTLIHCNALWQPSDLMEYEYLQGFYEDRIVNYSFSRNTRTAFTHYHLELPNRNMQPLLSGNYLLKVFHEGDPDAVVLTRRLMVVEPLVSIDATVKQATNLNFRATHQEIDFTIRTQFFPISNPYRDLRVVVRQNNRWDNAIIDLKPRLVQGSSLIYDYEDDNLFAGGNEFRNFDTKSLRFRSLHVREISPSHRGWDVVLMTDRNRRFLRYTTSNDINGRFLIRTEDYPDDMLESDYTWVHFSLTQPEPLAGGNVYVVGGFSDWAYTHPYRMEYNYHKQQYELSVLLKQGFYDYQYAFLEDGATQADVTLFEGSHSIAENDYSILVYYRRPGDLHDSLIGMQFLNSGM